MLGFCLNSIQLELRWQKQEEIGKNMQSNLTIGNEIWLWMNYWEEGILHSGNPIMNELLRKRDAI